MMFLLCEDPCSAEQNFSGREMMAEFPTGDRLARRD